MIVNFFASRFYLFYLCDTLRSLLRNQNVAKNSVKIWFWLLLVPLKVAKPYPDSGISEPQGKGCRSIDVKLENNF